MSDSSDRLVDPFAADDPGDGAINDFAEYQGLEPSLTVEGDQPLLDAEGRPVRELDLDRPDEIATRSATVRQLAVDEQVWRFGHVIVDEAQDLTPMQWRMVVRRSRQGAVTLLGDLAQRSIDQPRTWDDHLPPEFSLFEQQNLTINYRSPAEINEVASAILQQLVPDLPPSRSVRRSGQPVRFVEVQSLDQDLAGLVAAQSSPDASPPVGPPAIIACEPGELTERAGLGPDLRLLTPWQAKGLEFDSVVVVEPARFLDQQNGLSLLYVALTRSTYRLAVVHERPLPEILVPFAGP